MRLEFAIALHQRIERRATVARENLLHAREAEFLDGAARFAAEPRFIRGELAVQFHPLRLSQRLLLRTEHRCNRRAVHGGQRAGPRRIHGLEQRQRITRADAGERKAGHFVRRDLHVLCGEREVFGFHAVERTERAAIECSEAAASKIIVHLRPHRAQRMHGRFGVFAEHRDFLARAPTHPLRVGLQLFEKLLHFRRVHADRAGAIVHAAERAHDVFDQRLHGGVFRRLGRDDAVAVERARTEDPRGVRGFGSGERRGIGFAEIAQNLARGGDEGFARLVCLVHRGERKRSFALEQIGRVAEACGGPLDRGNQLRHANAPVTVRIDHCECFLVDFEPLHRAAERHPQLLVERVEVQHVLRRFEGNLVEPARAIEFPTMCDRSHSGSVCASFGSRLTLANPNRPGAARCA